MKHNFKTEWFSVLLIIAAWSFGIYFYQHFPDKVISHWNFAGKPDGYSSRASGAFAIPGLLTAMYIIFYALPFLDPKRERYESFEKVYNVFRNIIILALLAIYTVASLVNIGWNIKVGAVIPAIIGVMFIILGNYMGKLKQNWFMGVRFPWTLASENVWNKTNRFGGWGFMVAGLLMIFSLFLPEVFRFVILIISVLIITLGTAVYSFVIYKKEQKSLEQHP